MKLIIRADDFGFSEAINFGELAALKTGLVKSIGLMVNMPGSIQAAHIAKCFPEVSLGLHVNLVIGKPCSDITSIKSLVQENGNFISSKEYRRDLKQGKTIFNDRQAVKNEIEAQIKQFYLQTGKLPEYIDTHAVHSDNLFLTVQEIAKKYNLLFVATDPTYNTNLLVAPTRLSSSADFYKNGGKPSDYIKVIGQEMVRNKDSISYIVIHPGYLDDDVFAKSSFTEIRTHDVAMIKSKNTKEWLEEHDIELVSHRLLKEIK